MVAAHPFKPGTEPKPTPAGTVGGNVQGGQHVFYPAQLKPGQFVGTGGCGPSVGLIIHSPSHGTAVFHFGTTNSSVHPTINQYQWPADSHAIIFGGSSASGSNIVMNNVITSLQYKGIPIDGIQNAAAGYLGPDGHWYYDSRPLVNKPDP